jgi:hypothetical protein
MTVLARSVSISVNPHAPFACRFQHPMGAQIEKSRPGIIQRRDLRKRRAAWGAESVDL